MTPKCVICGQLPTVYPDPPEWAYCEECCPEHEYKYDKWRRAHHCTHCDKEKEIDYTD